MVRRHDGHEIAIEADVSELGDRFHLAMVRDVTAQRDLERERGSFLAAVSHDLKSPLAAISGQAQLLQRRIEHMNLPDGATIVRRLARIDETTSRMSRLIEDLLDVARLQMGRPLELNREEIDVVQLAQSSAQQLQPTATQHDIQVIASEPAVTGEWDRLRITRVIDNLLLNAVKYSPNGGDIRLTVHRDGEWAVLEVRDQGLGIPAADLPRGQRGATNRRQWDRARRLAPDRRAARRNDRGREPRRRRQHVYRAPAARSLSDDS